MLSEAKHLYDCSRDPSLSLRVTICKVTNVTLNNVVASLEGAKQPPVRRLLRMVSIRVVVE